MSIPIEANFAEDLRRHYLSELKRLGAADLPNEKSGVESVCVAYFNLLWRLIAPAPRIVFCSKELLARLTTTERKKRLDEIIAEVETGGDLTPRLSKSVLGKPLYNDKQLNDWGIRHLHVGPAAAPHGSELLYLYLKEDIAYLIDWKEHGAQSFADQNLVQILHDNWPEAIAEERPFGFVPGTLSPANLSPEARQMMRGHRSDGRKGAAFTMGTQVADGTIYLPLGGGVVGDGTALTVMRKVNYQRELAANVERWVRENPDTLRNGIEKHGGTRLDSLQLQYIVNADRIQVRELQTNLVLNLPE